MILINLLPFFIELIWDYLLIKSGKPDVISLKHRAAMIAGSVLVYAILQTDMTFIKLDKALIVAVLPYCFFDPLLNILRGKNWGAPASSKGWDRWLSKYDAEKVMYARILVAVGLIVLYFVL